MSYSVRYSAKRASWYVQVDGASDDYGTSLYDTEEEARAELSQMVSEGLITAEEIQDDAEGRIFDLGYEGQYAAATGAQPVVDPAAYRRTR